MRTRYRTLLALPIGAIVVLVVYLVSGALAAGVATLLILIPLGLYFLGQHTQFAVLGLLLDLWLVALLLRGPAAAAFAILASLLAVMLCSEVTICPQMKNSARSFLSLLCRASGLHRPIQVIRDGKVAVPEPSDGPLFGPCLIAVNDGNAAVLELGGQLTRIVGPGLCRAGRWEFVRKVVDLTPQQAKIDIEEAFTRDRIPLFVELAVAYRIQVDPQSLKDTGKHDFQEETIRKAVLLTHDWKEDTETSAASVTRDVIAMYYLDDLYDPRDADGNYGQFSPRMQLQRDIRNRLNAVVSNWGVRVDQVQIGRIDVPAEVKLTMLNKWQAEWEKQTTISRSEGAAEAYRLMEKARAQAQMQMVITVTEAFQHAAAANAQVPAQLISLRFMDALEKMARDPATKILLAPNVFDTLHDIRRVLTEGGN